MEGIFIQTLTCHGNMNDISCSSIKIQRLNHISLPLMKNMINTDLLCLVLVGTFIRYIQLNEGLFIIWDQTMKLVPFIQDFLHGNNLNNIFLQLFSQLSPLSLITNERNFNDCVILHIN